VKDPTRSPQYFIVERSVVSETLCRVVEAKRYLTEDPHLSILAAVRRAGLSRSAFYKYRESVFPFYDDSRGRNLTFSFDLTDTSGQLSSVLSLIASSDANILTINQTLPINGIANIVITIETTAMTKSLEALFNELKGATGLYNFRILARDH
jgi:chorismate mutase